MASGIAPSVLEDEDTRYLATMHAMLRHVQAVTGGG